MGDALLPEEVQKDRDLMKTGGRKPDSQYQVAFDPRFPSNLREIDSSKDDEARIERIRRLNQQTAAGLQPSEYMSVGTNSIMMNPEATEFRSLFPVLTNTGVREIQTKIPPHKNVQAPYGYV